jgi:hypothetical protein
MLFVKAPPLHVNIPLIWFVLLNLLFQFACWVYGLYTFSEWLLQFPGLLIGLLFGLFLLLTRLVDCEKSDLISVLAGQERGTIKDFKSRGAAVAGAKTEPAGAPAPEPATDPTKMPAAADVGPAGANQRDAAASPDVEFHKLVAKGDHAAAFAVYQKTVRDSPQWQPAAKDWLDLIQGLAKVGPAQSAITSMEDYLRRAKDPSPKVNLKLAQVLLRDHSRAGRALKVLNAIRDGALPRNLEDVRRQLMGQAEALKEQQAADNQDGRG